MTTAVYELIKRPTPVLRVMSPACNLVYDTLATAANEQGCASLTMAEIGRLTRRSRQAVWHALNRLIGARLLEVREHKTGRGNANVYFIRAFSTGRKRRKGPSKKVYMSEKFFSSPQSVNPPHYKETQKKLKSIQASEDTSAIKNPGHAMYLARIVLKSNRHLSEDEKATALQAIGFGIFKRGWFEKIKNTPGIFHDALHLLANRRPPGFPRRGAPRRWIFSWLFGLLASLEEKYRLGLGAMLERLHAGDKPRNCKGEPEVRKYSNVELSSLLASMDDKAPKPTTSSDVGQRRRGRVVRRRPTWSERGLTPSWARSST